MKAGCESSRWPGKALITLCATVAALGGGAQALGPAPAAAYLGEDDGCDGLVCEGDGYGKGGDGKGGSWDKGTAWEAGNSDFRHRNGAGADNGFGEDDRPADPDSNTGSTFGGDRGPYNPRNPSRFLQGYPDYWWAPDGHLDNFVLSKLRRAYSHCEDMAEELDEIRDDLSHDRSAGRWYLLQSEKSRLKGLKEHWRLDDCNDIYDQVGR